MNNEAPRDPEPAERTDIDHGREPIIQANGKEYLVIINGGVFVALSRAQAETIASRTRGVRRRG